LALLRRAAMLCRSAQVGIVVLRGCPQGHSIRGFSVGICPKEYRV
jgi:hypothetical protein